MLLGGAERLARAEHERKAEEALDHPVMDLASQRDPLAQHLRPLVLGKADPRARGERRGLAEGPHQVAVRGLDSSGAPPLSQSITPSRRPPAAIGTQASSSTRAAADGARGSSYQVAADHDPVLGQRPGGDRGLLERSVQLDEDLLLDPVAARG